MVRIAAVLVLTLALAATLSLACGEDSDVVVIGTDGEYFPYNFVNDAGEVDGFEKEMGDEVCRRAGLECEWIVTPWATIIDNLVDNQFDVIITGMSITDERDKTIDFTQAYLPATPSVYIALTDASDSAIDGLIAVGVNTVHSAYITEIGGEFVGFTVSDETVGAVLNGEADAGLFDREFAHTAIAENPGKLKVIGEPVLLEKGIGAGLRESDTELRDKIDAAISSMKEDGSLNDLIRKWFDDDAELF